MDLADGGLDGGALRLGGLGEQVGGGLIELSPRARGRRRLVVAWLLTLSPRSMRE